MSSFIDTVLNLIPSSFIKNMCSLCYPEDDGGDTIDNKRCPVTKSSSEQCYRYSAPIKQRFDYDCEEKVELTNDNDATTTTSDGTWKNDIRSLDLLLPQRCDDDSDSWDSDKNSCSTLQDFDEENEFQDAYWRQLSDEDKLEILDREIDEYMNN